MRSGKDPCDAIAIVGIGWRRSSGIIERQTLRSDLLDVCCGSREPSEYTTPAASLCAALFGVSSAELQNAEPTHRLAFELLAESLADGELSPAAVAGERTTIQLDCQELKTSGLPRLNAGHTEGLGAVHAACRALREADATLAVAGCISIARAGESRSETAGILVLQPLYRALAERRGIYAVIRASAFAADPEARSTGGQSLRDSEHECVTGRATIDGLIELALSLRSRRVPASGHAREGTDGPEPASGAPRIVALDSNGASGTTTHFVLEEAPRQSLDAAVSEARTRAGVANWLYRLDWPPLPRPPAAPQPSAAHGSCFVVLKNGGGLAVRLVDALCARGHRCEIYDPCDPSWLAAVESGRIEGIVYLGGLDAVVTAPASGESVAARVRQAMAPLLAFVRSRSIAAEGLRLWVVTRGACSVAKHDQVSPCQTALWGLARVVALENPETWGGLIDLDPDVSRICEAEVEALAFELESPSDDDQLAFRCGQRHVARLTRAEPELQTVSLSKDGSYLITGGLGRLGLACARWLVARGARHLVLASRHELPPKKQWRAAQPAAIRAQVDAIQALTAAGARVSIVRVDVADASAMAAVIARIKPALRGVIHAAGVAPVRSLAETDEAAFDLAFRAKVCGGWVLHELLRDRSLDVFVMFSSVAAVWGGRGQGAYAAANAFLDGLANQRRAQGLPALSIDWGSFADGGVNDPAMAQRLAGIGVLPMPAELAWLALEQLWHADGAQWAVARVDWHRFSAVYGSRRRRRLLASLVRDERDDELQPSREALRRLRAHSAPELREMLWSTVREAVADVLGVASPETLDTRLGFADQGVDSLMASEIHARLQRALGIELATTVAFDHPSLERLLQHLEQLVRTDAGARSPVASPIAVRVDEPIAIVGAACRFPGADDVSEYFRLLLDRTIVSADAPADRWSETFAAKGGFLRDVQHFDAEFFRISPREATTLDPQQRLLLEVGWEALEHAGLRASSLRGSSTGVFVCAAPNEYGARLHGISDEGLALYGGTGNLLSVVAGRLSFFLGLQGPTLAVDTASSSSLVALHLACQSLRLGECEQALIGGVNLMLSPENFLKLSRLGTLSPDGRSKPFAAAADGYGRGEACVVLVVKRLSDAQASGDRILAVVRGSAINHDGASSGLAVPNGPAQETLLRTALARAGLRAADVDFVECHGTGTRLGDPIEVHALATVYGEGRASDRPVSIGSVKANIGHTEAAAGLTGVLKLVLSLDRELVPAQPEFGELNPHIPWQALPVAVVREPQRWTRGERPRRGAVSSFGISGTNAHAVLEEAPRLPRRAATATEGPELFVLSASSTKALDAQAERLRAYLEQHPELGLRDLAFSLATTRSALERRLAFAASSREQLVAALAAISSGAGSPAVARNRARSPAKVAFLFTGQGAQTLGMGRVAYARWPAFRAAFDRCAALFDRALNKPLLDVMWAEPDSPNGSLLDQTRYAQPALFTLEFALAALWRDWHVTPAWMLGHSLGELVAACIAGVFSLEDAVRLVSARAALMQALPAGAMVSIAASELEVIQALAAHGERVSIASVNGPAQVVISGPRASVEAVASWFVARGVRTRALRVSHAFHSPAIDGMLSAFERVAETVSFQRPSLPVVSNLTGRVYGDEVLQPSYWVRQARAAVQFAAGLRTLHRAGVDTFVEIGPRETLLGLVPACTPDSNPRMIASLRAGRDEASSALLAFGSLWSAGGAIDLTSVVGAGQRVELPLYAWQRNRYWIEPSAAPEAREVAIHAEEPASGPDDARSSLLGRTSIEVRDALRKLVGETVAGVLGFSSADALDAERGFAEQGLDSVLAAQIHDRLQRALAITLSTTVAFDYPTLERLVLHLEQLLRGESASPLAIERSSNLAAPIAIVGAACRFPEGTEDLDAYWQLLIEGSVIGVDAPPDRRGEPYATQAGFLRDVQRFDAAFFHISPREATSLDPQQRLLLEVAWEALEHAGVVPASLRGSSTGVFVGAAPNEYGERLHGVTDDAVAMYGGTGNLLSVVAGRLSFFLGLQGPALAVDTACSSSLVALHLACQSLRFGECDQALVGGVNLILSSDYTTKLSRLGALSLDARCKTFSAAANGYGRSEACAVVVVKRLSDALAAGDRILGVVRGTAVNHDGPSSGLTVPNGPAQQVLLRRALAQAELAPADIDFVECHGTGTALGDPIEVQAIAGVYGENRAADRPLTIGAVKANVGHTEVAAGLAGVLKVLLAFDREQIPAQPELGELSPHIPWNVLPLAVPRQPQAWARGERPRRAGVSAFGISGTNAHAVLEEPPLPQLAAAAPARSAELCVISAASEHALRAQAARLAEHLARHPDRPLADLAYSLATTRAALEYRLAVSASSLEALSTALTAASTAENAPGLVRGRVAPSGTPKVVFVFPGHGSQWLGMGRTLMQEEPAFREALEACDRAIFAEAGWSLLAELEADEASSQLQRTDIVQPALFAMAVSLAALWRSWGVEPQAVVGHSMGEIAAGYVSGALSLADAVAVVCRRSQLLLRITGQGEMALIELPLTEAEQALRGYEERLSVAVNNSPRSSVIAGEPVAMAEVLSKLEARGVFCRRVKVDYASHSPQVDPLREDIVAALRELSPRPSTVPMRSTLRGAVLEGTELVGAYWAENLRQPVRFCEAVQQLIADGHGLFIEMSPHPLLTAAVDEILRASERPGTIVGSLRRNQPEVATLLESVGAVWAHGQALRWEGRFASSGTRVSLPTYAFQRERYWLESAENVCTPRGGHPLLGEALTISTQPGTRVWQTELPLERLHWLNDHCVQGAVVFPGAGYLEMALAASSEALDGHSAELGGVVFSTALVLADQLSLQLVTTEEGSGEVTFRIASRTSAIGPAWREHAHGTLRPIAESARADVDLDALRARLELSVAPELHYENMTSIGLEYGAAFQGVSALWKGEREALGSVRLPEPAGSPAEFRLHPALLDACFHVVLAAFDTGDGRPWLPVAVASLQLVDTPIGESFCYARMLDAESADRQRADLVLVDESGRTFLQVRGLELQRLATSPARLDDRMLEVTWQTAPAPRARIDAGRWLLVGGGGVAAALESALHAQGHEVIRTDEHSTSALKTVLSEAFDGEAPAGVVHLGSLELSLTGGADAFDSALARGCDAALGLVQALAEVAYRDAPRLWLVTRGAQAVGGGELSVLQAALIGFGRVVALEQADLRCSLIDLEPSAPEGEIHALVAELVADDAEEEVALRGPTRHAMRLAPCAPEPGPEVSIHADASYLITGGLGGLGLLVANWLAERGAGQLVLVGRVGASSPEQQLAVSALQARGVDVRVVAADVADRSALERVFAEIAESPWSLRGVIHAAGVLDDGLLLQQTPARLRGVMAAKIRGALHLHALSRNLPLDFFVLYSSATGLFGSPGQAGYAAANTCLDALAHQRRALGLPGLSIDWGPFSDIGLAARDENRGARLAFRGIRSLAPEEGLRALERLLGGERAQVAVASLDFRQWIEFYPRAGASTRLARLVRASTSRPTGDRELLRQLAAAEGARRLDLVLHLLRRHAGDVLRLAEAKLDLDAPLTSLGMDSLMGLELRNRIEAALAIKVPVTLLWTYPTLAALAAHLDRELGSGSTAAQAGSNRALRQRKPEPGSSVARELEPIAVVGIACRFPGGADSPAAFWSLLEEGRDAIQSLDERWRLVGARPVGEAPRWAGLLTHPIDRFDAAFFGISPREARSLDPQHRMLLELAWESFEHAGIAPRSLAGSKTGVFVGAMWNEYQYLVSRQAPEDQDAYSEIGNLLSVAAGRVSYSFGLEGPCLTVDTACSSSLVAIHLACRSLRSSESELALAGGVNILLSPEVMAGASRLKAVSPDGRCKTFDASANGYVRGEGCGFVVLKRLSEAERDGDRIWALIRGSAMNQDGRSTGLTTPNVLAQQALLREALESSRVEPSAITYVETHGTGTSLGDPIEVEALREVLGSQRQDRARCVLGALKTNFGHLESAAGIAGFIKTVLAFEHEQIPRNLNFRTLNPRIRLEGTALELASDAVAWPRAQTPRFAGVSSFGLSGTNAHIVLQEAPLASSRLAMPERSAELFVLSARSARSLDAQAAKLAAHLRENPQLDPSSVAFTLATSRSALEHRLSVVASSRATLLGALDAAANGGRAALSARGNAAQSGGSKVVFVFSGQGSQWLGMGRTLMQEEPAFREALEACDRAIFAEAGWSLLAELEADEASSQLQRTDIVQPALFAMAVSLAALWRSWGVEPQAVVGHSMGEIAAGYVSGALSLADAVAVVCRRSQLLLRITGQGEMALIELPLTEAEQALRGYEERLSVAVNNSPRSSVIAGEPVAMAEVLSKLEARGVFCRRVKVDYASHSPQVDPLREDIVAALRELSPRPSTVPMRSTLRGAVLEGTELVGAYWAENLRQPVRFCEAVQQLIADGHGLFIEMSPHPILAPAVEEVLEGHDGASTGSLRRGQPERASLLHALGTLWTRGNAPAWDRMFPSGENKVVLPTYAWDRDRYWIDLARASGTRQARDPLADWFYEVDWVEAPHFSQPSKAASGPWLLLGAPGGTRDALAAGLEARGHSVTVVRPPFEEPAIAQAVSEQAWRGIVYVAGSDGVEASASSTDIAESTRAATWPVIGLMKQLTALTEPPRLWIVTRAGCAVGGDREVVPSHAALWGTGRIAGLEHPAAWGGLIDLEAECDVRELEGLVTELLAPDGEDQIAFRSGRRWVARLIEASLDAPAARPPLSDAGTYLVTGGLGGVGAHVARWLVQRGARHIALLGRRGRQSPGAAELVAELEASGARATVEAADVADAEGMAKLIAALDPPLRGVVHAAGVVEDGLLAHQTEERLVNVLHAKVEGAWVLDSLTRGLDLDFFVLFSSLSAIFGLMGQGTYAAANACLDTLARSRRARGLPGVSLAWGLWADGMGSSKQRSHYEELGVLVMPTELALEAMERAIAADVAQRMVGSFDWQRVRSTRFAIPGISSRILGRLGEVGRLPVPAAAKGQPELAAKATEITTRAELQALVRSVVARVLGFDAPTALDPARGFAEQGLDSLMAIEIRNQLQRELAVTLSATLAFDHPSVDRLCEHLAVKLLRLTERPSAGAHEVRRSAVDLAEPIAIVGASCRLPGGVEDLDGFWKLLRERTEVVSDVPADRWDMSQWYDPDPDAPGRAYAARAGFLRDVYSFDAPFFHISPREAASLDPQQRLLLEVAWEALERAEQSPRRLRQGSTGVFVGVASNEFVDRMDAMRDEAADRHIATGLGTCFIAGRLSFVLGVHGPSLSVDTGCSSSLVALHLACQSLRLGECDQALVGGVHALLSPRMFVAISRLRALSPDGRCKTFSAAADGFGRGEGCVVMVCKRLADAERDGDRILAVVRGTAVNHDGPSSGLTVPHGPAQEALIGQALANAGVAPADIDFVECHGTGTTLGDPIEVQALGSAYGEGRNAGRALWLGAVKANVGHSEAAAGLTGLLKVALALEHEEIPGQPAIEALSPHIDWESLPVAVARDAVRWPRGERPRRAAVSSFGMGGTNAHAIVEEAPRRSPASPAPERSAELFMLSAKSPEALNEQAARLSAHLSEQPDLGLGEVAFSLATTRSAMEHRLAVVASSREELSSALAAAAQRESASAAASRRASARGKLVFLFTGQGAQVVGMGRDLHETWPAFREAFDRCVALFDRELDRPLREVMWAEPGSSAASLLDETGYTQPALFALEYALSALWGSWGVTPELLIGHSLGEIVAACVAGVFSLEDAVKLVAARARLMQALSSRGAMVSIAAAEAEVALELAVHNRATVSIASINGPEQVVISGASEPVQAIAASFASRGVRARSLVVSHPFHSPAMDAMLDSFGDVAAAVTYDAPKLPIASNLTGGFCPDQLATPAYWVRHAREAVRFAEGVRTLRAAGADTFIEIGPKPMLLGLVSACLPGEAIALSASMRSGRDENVSVLEALGGLWTLGVELDAAALFPSGTRRVPLPTYAFQRERYWLDSPARRSASLAAAQLDPSQEAPPAPAGEREGVFDLVWEEAAVPSATLAKARWMLLGGDAAASSLCAALEAAGHAVVCVAADESNPRALQTAIGRAFEGQAPTALVQLGALEVPRTLDGETLELALAYTCDNALGIVQALSALAFRDPPRLWLVTRGAQALDQSGFAVAQAPLLGLARVIALEHPELRVASVDLDPARPDAELEALLGELLGDGAEAEVAFRRSTRCVSRLVPRAGDPESRIRVPATELAVDPAATYLITGGLGGLGLRAAAWLAECGASQLVLAGRSGAASSEQRAAVQALIERGVRVNVARVDVADRSAVEGLLREIDASGIPLRGIVHAAGRLDDGLLLNQTPTRLRGVLEAKAWGALHLHELTRDKLLDFFVMYASAAGVLGSPGQGSYAAANAFLDALAHHRKSCGLPALSVDWGGFSEVGMAVAEENRGARLSHRGIRSMSPEQGTSLLADLLAHEQPAQVVVALFDARQWVEFYPTAAASQRLSKLLSAQRPARAPRKYDVLERLAAAELRRRSAVARAFFREQVADVLRVPERKLEDEAPLTSLGMDSLMGLELRNRIMDAAFGVHVPATLLWTYTSIAELAEFLLDRTGLANDESAPAPKAEAAVAQELSPLDLDEDGLLALVDEEIALARTHRN